MPNQRAWTAALESNKKALIHTNKGFYEGGGAGRNRTDDRGFAVLGLTTWRPRLICL